MNAQIPRDLADTLLRLESDIDALGWDQPARLYEIHNDEDPYLVLALPDLSPHPFRILGGLAALGVRVPPAVRGLALATEGWKYSEAMLQRINTTPDWKAAFDKGEWHPDIPLPAETPDRVEVRVVQAVMRDDSFAAIKRVRGDEARLWEDLAWMGGRLFAAMKQLLST